MKETEKRHGMKARKSNELKTRLTKLYGPARSINRTVLVKVDNHDFSSSPDELIDIKVKLVDKSSVLAVKYGSWHSDASRQEHEIRFDRNDLGSVLNFLVLMSYTKFVLLTTTRHIWKTGDAALTLDEYQHVHKSLFEVEADASVTDGEAVVDHIFSVLDMKPMNSAETVQFINSLNRTKELQVDLSSMSVDGLMARMLDRPATAANKS